MEDLIKKIRAVEPTKEQLKDRTPEYAFGWVDSLNAITEVVKNNVDLHNVSNRRELLLVFYQHLIDNDPFPIHSSAKHREVDRFLKANNCGQCQRTTQAGACKNFQPCQ